MPNPTVPQPHDTWANYYDHVYERTYGAIYNDLTTATLGYIEDTLHSGTILDFGAGTGRLSIPLREMGYGVIAVERSKGMADALQAKASQRQLDFPIHACSMAQYKGSSADMALCLFTVLSYATTEEELLENLSNIYHHLSPKGYLFFDLPNPIFFQQRVLANINTTGLSRHITLGQTGKPHVYQYREDCSGIFDNQEFAYTDAFNIKYWSLDEVDRILQQVGFADRQQAFPAMSGTGSTYKLYQKQ